MRRGVLITILLLLFALSPTHAQDNTAERNYYAYIPSSYDSSQAVPLLIALHPFAASGKAMAALTGFDQLAEEHGFIVVYPDSLNYGWDDGRTSYQTAPDINPVDDLGFLIGLIDEFTAKYNIDRVYLAGFANGGLMAYRLACEFPDRFAKVFITGALLWDYHLSECSTETPKPVNMLLTIGTKDVYYPLEGRLLNNTNAQIAALTLEETVTFWRDFNGCQEARMPNESLHIFDSCEKGGIFATYVMEGVGHNWPRIGDYALNQFDVDLSQIATEFFMEGEWENILANTTISNRIFGGTPRSYTFYVPPSYNPAEPTPLVVGLHGRPHNGYGFAFILDMNKTAQEHNFIVVYPDGIDEGWNYTRGFDRYYFNDVDDVDFLTTLVDDLALDLNIDPKRIYIMGFSNGGFMTQRLACEQSDKFAAFAVIGATLFPGFAKLCEATPPLPIIFIHGTEDPSIPWGGITQGSTIIAESVFNTLTFWAVHNKCNPEESTSTNLPQSGNSPDTSVVVFSVGGCADNSEILLYAIQGGGHTIPGVNRLSAGLGTVNMDFHAADVIWEFFEPHTLNQ